MGSNPKIKSELKFSRQKLNLFIDTVKEIKSKKQWIKKDIVELFDQIIPNFNHVETNKYLDDKM